MLRHQPENIGSVGVRDRLELVRALDEFLLGDPRTHPLNGNLKLRFVQIAGVAFAREALHDVAPSSFAVTEFGGEAVRKGAQFGQAALEYRKLAAGGKGGGWHILSSSLLQGIQAGARFFAGVSVLA